MNNCLLPADGDKYCCSLEIKIQEAQLLYFSSLSPVYTTSTRWSRLLYSSDQLSVCLSKTDKTDKRRANIGTRTVFLLSYSFSLSFVIHHTVLFKIILSPTFGKKMIIAFALGRSLLFDPWFGSSENSHSTKVSWLEIHKGLD